MKPFPAALNDQIGKGGFAVVFRDPRDPSVTCIKQFKQPVVGDGTTRLRHLSELELWARPSEIATIKTCFSWPLELFGDDQRILGYTMPLAPDDAFIRLRAAGRESRRLLEISYLTVKDYFRKGAVTSNAPDFSFGDRIDLALSVCDAITVLHEHDLVFRDVSARNIAARLTTPRTAFILDADSIVDVNTAQREPITSPGWQVSPSHDPLQTDRAKLALLVLRLLVEDNDARPPQATAPLKARGLQSLAEAITRCYEEATSEAIAELLLQLRTARTPDSARHAWRTAVGTGFASPVIREKPAAVSDDERRLVQAAEQHAAAERSIALSDVPTQKKMLARLAQIARFKIDLPSEVGVVPAPRTEEELIQLVFDAQFVDIARHLSTSGLPNLRDHPLISRVADRAAFEADRPVIRYELKPGAATIHIEWPASYYCNAIEISLGSSSSEIVTRDTSRAKITREIRLKNGGNVDVGLRTGITTPQGETFLSSDYLVTTTLVIPPVPAPPRPASSRPTVDMSTATIVDLNEEAREAENAARRRKKRRRIIAIASVLTIVLGYATWKLLPSEDTPVRDPSGARIFRH